VNPQADRATDTMRPAVHSGAFASLRHRDFAVIWTAALFSNTGSWMQTLTVPFVLDQLTHSTAVVGLGALFTFLPMALVVPIAGSLADRRSRRNVLLGAQAVMMLAAFGLWALWTTGVATPVNLLACVFVTALANGITQATWAAFVPQLVPREDMMNAVRLNIMQYTGARAFGPALGGVVLATLGPSAAFFANGLSFVIVLVALFATPDRHVGDTTPTTKVMAHFWEGVRYVRHRRLLATATLTMLVLAFFGQSMVQLVEPFTRRVLHVGAGQYGAMVGAYGVGAILGSLVTVYGARFRRSRMTVTGFGLFAGAQIAFGLAPGYAFAFSAMIIIGAAFIVCQVSVQTAVQVNVDETHRGRVLSIYFAAFFAGGPVGALIGGVAGELVGLRATFVAAAIILIVYIIYASARYERFRLFDQPGEPGEALETGPHATVDATGGTSGR
jgi:MFS family permease